MFKLIKKLIKKNSTVSLSLSIIALSLFVGLYLPKTSIPTVNRVTVPDQGQDTPDNRPLPPPSPKPKYYNKENRLRDTLEVETPPYEPQEPELDDFSLDELKDDMGNDAKPRNYADDYSPESDEEQIVISGSCDTEKTDNGGCLQGEVCAQVTDNLWLCQNPELSGTQTCEAYGNYYAHGYVRNIKPTCQKLSGVPTGWVVSQQKCNNGSFVDVNISAPTNGVGDLSCPAVYSCNRYNLSDQDQAERFILDGCCDKYSNDNKPNACPKPQIESESQQSISGKITGFLSTLRSLFF